jgi:AcrR family transcriptional regulator
VAVDASATRAKLIAAGEKLFATHGIYGAQMRDIVRAAGQANDSAVHYHFGSRQGLLTAICETHLEAMEPERVRRLAAQDTTVGLEPVIADMIEPTAERLHTQAGRYFLRITAQLAGHAGVRGTSGPHPVVSPALRAQLQQLRRICAESVPDPVADERVAITIGTLTSALADRAVAMDDHHLAFALDEPAFVANLRAMLVAALRAPVPAAAG